jgi:hypothetical protein
MREESCLAPTVGGVPGDLGEPCGPEDCGYVLRTVGAAGTPARCSGKSERCLWSTVSMKCSAPAPNEAEAEHGHKIVARGRLTTTSERLEA